MRVVLLILCLFPPYCLIHRVKFSICVFNDNAHWISDASLSAEFVDCSFTTVKGAIVIDVYVSPNSYLIIKIFQSILRAFVKVPIKTQ